MFINPVFGISLGNNITMNSNDIDLIKNLYLKGTSDVNKIRYSSNITSPYNLVISDPLSAF